MNTPILLFIFGIYGGRILGHGACGIAFGEAYWHSAAVDFWLLSLA
jgi:hypothetical protein